MIGNVCSYRTVLYGAAILALLIQGPSPAFALDLESKEEIKNLMLCYGAGADAIGDSTRVDPEGDGAAIYAQCFTDDAPFSVWFPGTPFDGPPTIPPIIGPDAWAAFVAGVFTANAYTFTQHALSNFIVEVSGKTGTLTAYLNAAHVKQSGGVVTAVEVAHGTYTLEVEKIKGAWKITALALTLINFTPFFP